MRQRCVLAGVMALVVSVFCSAVALAQDQLSEGKNEIGGARRPHLHQQSGNQRRHLLQSLRSLRQGFHLEVNYARRLAGNLVYAVAVEVPAVFNIDEDLNSGANVVPQDYQQIFITPSLRANLFPDTKDLSLGEFWRRIWAF